MYSKIVYTILLLSYVVDCYNYYSDQPQPIYLSSSVGSYVVFNCDVDFPHSSISIPYMLNWNKDNETIFSWFEGIVTSNDPYVGRINLMNDQSRRYGLASINLTAIRDTDGGWYECQVVFPNRTPSTRKNGTWYYLTVNGGNILAVPPVNQTVLEGEEAQFPCLSKEPEIKPMWYKDGLLLTAYHDLKLRFRVTPEGTLVINPTEMGDFGEYECRVYVGEDMQAASAYLDVQYKAKVIYAPPEIHLLYGRPALIDCHFRANPPLTNLRWEKDGFLFDPYNIHGVFYRRNGSLYFSNVNENHNGVYTCTPYNSLGTNGPSPAMHVIVQRPPVFVVTPHHLYLKKLGETLVMPCDARDGENGHKPNVIWFRKDGNSLPTGRYSVQDGNLTLINIQLEDRGIYQCSATNRAATISAETELVVENVPSSAPYNLTAVASATSVHITWQSGRNRANTRFSVWYKPVDFTEWKTYYVNSKALEATITNLNPGREYEFMVLCKDENGDGLFSKSMRVYTKGVDGETNRLRANSFPPVGFPRNVTVHPTDVGYLVTWDPPEYGLENLKMYIVRWSQGPEDYLFGSAEARNTSYLITNLSEGNEYNIYILAVSQDDQHTSSEKITVTIPGYKRIRAVSTGIVTGLAFLVAICVAIYYGKKKCRKPSYTENSKPQTKK